MAIKFKKAISKFGGPFKESIAPEHLISTPY